MSILQQLLIICPLVFFAGFVDSIAGGGGIISLPAYAVVGLSPHMALGTNKFASTWGTMLSTFRFFKNGKIHLKAAAVSIPSALIGSWCGARLALFLSEQILQYVLIAALPVLAVFILTKKDLDSGHGGEKFSSKVTLLLSGFFAFLIGGYDGFFGPGTGTFLILVFHAVIGFDILTASGNAKMVNLCSNMAAMVIFILSGNVNFMIGLPAAVCCIAGNYTGSGLALTRGSRAIRPVFLGVLLLLLIKIGMDLFGSNGIL